ncbi:MAG TPA: HAMP domain-containing histidine kinase [Spirochaetia bacterium]|nr:HAMP domain-containing histidine kinase [Spirochaetia bacterium]
MKNLFTRMVGAFLLTQIVFTAVLAVIFLFGYHRSLSLWQEEQDIRLARFAREVLTGAVSPTEAEPPTGAPLFIFNARRELIWTNRGGGHMHMMRMDQGDLRPVRTNGSLRGYYSSPRRQFGDDSANTAFVEAMGRVIAFDVAVTFLIGIALAFILSRSLAKPATLLALRLDAMATGDLASPVTVEGPEEITSIARSTARLARQLETEQQARRRWTADLAHDLKTPLSAMKAQFEGLADGVLDATPERIGRLRSELERMEELVKSLEELMKLETPELVVKKEAVALGPLFEDLVARFGAGAARKKVRLQPAASAETVPADPLLLERALSNLIANAVRHVNEGGLIRLSAERRHDRVLLRVANSGTPIPPDELPRVFDRLYRGEYARTTPGSGLGLTIARQIAELHGGTIGIENDAEKGTTVTITLPTNANGS